MRQFLNIAKALSDESRVRLLLALRGGELCVCWLIELLGLAPSTVSKHMTILAQADLALSRTEGRWHYYRLPGEGEATPTAAHALGWLEQDAGGSAAAKQDAKRLKEIRKSRKTAAKAESAACCKG